MPKNNIDYSKCVIYKIVCNDLSIEDIYVGSTTEFIKRKYRHKRNTNFEGSKEYNFNVYKCIRENGGWENWSMYEIEKYPCNDSNEARAKERYWYEELKANLNMRTPKCETIIKIKEKIPFKGFKYTYPEYYKHCNKKNSFNEICELNKQYSEKHLK